MRKILVLLAVAISILSCDKRDENTELSKDYVTIGLDFGRSTIQKNEKNLIAVQVYNYGKPYAYGLFDNASKIDGKFPKGGEYSAKSTLVINGKEDIAEDIDGYLRPFARNGTGTPLTNKFVFSSSEYFDGITESAATLKDNGMAKKFSIGRTVELPPLDRYYGESDSTRIGDDSIIVDMSRYVFGIRVNVHFEGDMLQPTDWFKMCVAGSGDTITVFASDSIKTFERIYTYNGISKRDTPASVEVLLYTNKSHGETWQFNAHETLYRNYLMILDQTIRKSEDRWINPQKWGGIEGYYGDGDYGKQWD